MKKVFLCIGTVLFLYIIFVAEESIRLMNNAGALPLYITAQTKCSEKCAQVGKQITLEYLGIGYKLEITYYHSPESSEDNDIFNIVKEDFYLFNKFHLWGWVS